jgi:multidrug efflux system membrane fusion protein
MAVRQNALVVPNQAVQTGQDGTYVYVVQDNQTVEMRPVNVGLRVDQDLVIDKGLNAGETVVTEGQLRLAPGSRVLVGGPNGPGGNRQGGRGGAGRKGGKGGKGGDGGGPAGAPDGTGRKGKRQPRAEE